MAYSGVFVFGDSLVDAGNALKLAEFADNVSLSDMPAGIPTSDKGYFDGRFTDGLTYADLISNKFLSVPTTTVFPFGFSDPWLGLSFEFTSDPVGNNLNFAYGGAQIRQGSEVVPDLDDQTDAFRDAVDGKADPGALHLVTMGGNDVRSLVPDIGIVVDAATARTRLTNAALEMRAELGDLINAGVRHLVVTGIPNVGMIPEYEGVADEAARRATATEYSAFLDGLIQQHLVELRAQHPQVTIHSVSLVQATAEVVGKLDRIFAPEALAAEASASDILFFDAVHPTAQAHALLAGFILDSIASAPAGEALALTTPSFSVEGSIEAAGETDRIVVSLAAQTSYTFEMLGLSSGSGSLADPVLRVIGPGGLHVGFNDDSGLGLDASLAFTTTDAGDYVVELRAAGGLSGSYRFQLSGAMAPGAIYGSNGDDRLIGTEQAETIRGLSGNDLLDGGSGADRMEGGTGNDVYIVDNAADKVVEIPGEGFDEVRSSVSHRLSEWTENLTLTGAGAINGTGNFADNRITGNAAANTFRDGGGADTFVGGGGDDHYVVSAHVIFDSAGNFFFSDLDEVVEEAGGGVDTLETNAGGTLHANLENMILSGKLNVSAQGNSSNNSLTGNSGVNVLAGLGGDDVLDGGAGADRMEGGAGNDLYVLDNAADRVVEASSTGGTDTVRSSVNHQLGLYVENLTLVGDALAGTGNSAANRIIGNGLDNVLKGGSGADRLEGGAGNDSYFVDNARDVLVEGAAAGRDTVTASFSYTLGSNLEDLVLAGTSGLSGHGNTLANMITGNSGDNLLKGNSGADMLAGMDGADRLHGGSGKDVLSGGAGADRFIFDSALSSASNVDRLSDFSSADDTIVLDRSFFGMVGADGTLAATAFCQGTRALDSTDRIVYNKDIGAIYYDADGSGAALAILFAMVEPGTALNYTDFSIIA
ncbi:MAG: SGNH/GDSL hydrolase family protein [Pseudomonadota bacterium]|nr:SGNH/GDSL hydrolase family protein [Pseudomonadota bacterium]